VVAVPAYVASSLAWGLIRSLVEPGIQLLPLLGATVIFVAAWAAGLVLAAAVMTWRQLVGGLEVVRTGRRSQAPATLGIGPVDLEPRAPEPVQPTPAPGAHAPDPLGRPGESERIPQQI
ncbi:MAG TPA: hypothetical protein VNF73_13085, partial [Candidatus Saccharimonadales bacterium]|nr:hypothetical protein [Candidatus Saccharimonadales bacterium]